MQMTLTPSIIISYSAFPTLLPRFLFPSLEFRVPHIGKKKVWKLHLHLHVSGFYWNINVSFSWLNWIHVSCCEETRQTGTSSSAIESKPGKNQRPYQYRDQYGSRRLHPSKPEIERRWNGMSEFGSKWMSRSSSASLHSLTKLNNAFIMLCRNITNIIWWSGSSSHISHLTFISSASIQPSQWTKLKLFWNGSHPHRF